MSSRICRNKKGFEAVTTNEGEYLDRRKSKRRKRKDFLKKTTEERERPTIEEISLGEKSEEEIGEEIQCLAAQTSLVIPISYETIDSNSLSNELFLRKFRFEEHQEIPFWIPLFELPSEIQELSAQFKQFVGSPSLQKTWTCTRLRLNPDIVKVLFSKVRLVAIQGGTEIEYNAYFQSIDMSIYPLGIVMLVFHINWLPQNTELTLFDMRSILFVSKHMNIIGDISKGWKLNDDCSIAPFYKAIEQLTPELYAAIYEGTYISLKSLCDWLFRLTFSKSPSSRLNVIRNAFHHSVVVVDRELPNHVLMDYLFHMRRAFGQTNRPPINSASTLGKVLVWRRNRYLGVSREGIISLSWPLSGEYSFNSCEYEVKVWPRKIVGIYLILAIHVHGEKMVFLELSDLAVAQAEYLQDVLNQSNLQPIKEARNQLRNLATMLARYTLGMSSGDCGGTSEYSEFFVTLRKEFGISDLRNELCEELKDILAVVESTYLEEERTQRFFEEFERRERYARQKYYFQERERKLRKFEFVGSMAAALALPFVVVSGIFGMNLEDLPHPGFGRLMFWTSIGALVFLVLMIFINVYRGQFRRANHEFERIN